MSTSTPFNDFDAAYRGGSPPWDIGAQPVIADLVDSGAVTGEILDVGCGTGEHALPAASRRLLATGIDVSTVAIDIAREKANARGLDVRFIVHDAMELGRLETRSDTVIDAGLFHVFDDDLRATYVERFSHAVQPGGRLVLLCFSDRVQPLTCGWRRIHEAEIREAFADQWEVRDVRPVANEGDSGVTVDVGWSCRGEEFAAQLAQVVPRPRTPPSPRRAVEPQGDVHGAIAKCW